MNNVSKRGRMGNLAQPGDGNSTQPTADALSDDGVLTLEKFEASIKYMQSDEYNNAWQERSRKRAYNEVFISQLHQYKLITEPEYLYLWTRIEPSGYMMVSKTWWDKLEPLEPKLKKLITDKQIKSFLFPKAKKKVTDMATNSPKGE